MPPPIEPGNFLDVHHAAVAGGAMLAAALTPSDLQKLEQRRRHEAMRGFVAWFEKEVAAGGVTMSDDNLLVVQPQLSRLFAIGMHASRYYVAIPPAVAGWFPQMPWRGLEVAKSRSWLYLVTEPITIGDRLIPGFRIAFDVNPSGYEQGLLHYHFVDVRLAQLAAGDDSFAISREVYLTLPVHISSAS